MDHVDSKYIGLLSVRLEKFKRVKSNLYNFRCPICGDSKKNKNRTRGYFYAAKANVNFKCHNCGASMSFNNFLKKVDPTIHKQYTFEKFKENKTGRNFTVDEPKFKFEAPQFKQGIKLPKASENVRAATYLEGRKLDPSKFYYTDKFKEWTNSMVHTFDSVEYDEPRIIIPLHYKKNLIGFQGRALGPSKVKYITIMLDENRSKVYGLNRVDFNKTVYVTEGPFDSLYIDNAIAMAGADIDWDMLEGKEVVFVFDNEKRNREIVKRMEKAISKGYEVVIWPSSLEEKDINDMFNAGHDVQSLVEFNTYEGLEASIKLSEWKKV